MECGIATDEMERLIEQFVSATDSRSECFALDSVLIEDGLTPQDVDVFLQGVQRAMLGNESAVADVNTMPTGSEGAGVNTMPTKAAKSDVNTESDGTDVTPISLHTDEGANANNTLSSEFEGADVNNSEKSRGNKKLARAPHYMLYTASAMGQLEIMKFLVENKAADVNYKHHQTLTHPVSCPTVLATARGEVECLRYLISKGADVNPQGVDTNTPLVHATRAGSTECVKLLLESGADVNLVRPGGYSPLMGAAEGGNAECVKLLLEAGADVNAKDDDKGETPLMKATAFRRVECMKLLLKAGAEVNPAVDPAPLLVAVGTMVLKSVKVLLEAGAAGNRQPECVRLLLKYGAHVNMYQGSIHCFLPVSQISKAVPRLLLAAGEKQVVLSCPPESGSQLDSDEEEPEKEVQFHPEGYEDLDLKNQCRKVIRKHLLTLDPHTNLFIRVPQLQMTNERPGLPDDLVSYLLHDQSLDDSDDDE